MKIDKQPGISGATETRSPHSRPDARTSDARTAGTRGRNRAQAPDAATARKAGDAAPAAEARPAKRSNTSGFSLQLNQQLSSMQSSERYLGELSDQLGALKLSLSRQLSAPQASGEREAIVQGIQQVNSLLAERSKRSAQSLDANFKLRLNESLRSRVSIQGLDSIEAIQRAGKETLVFSGGRALGEPLTVMFDDHMNDEQILRRLNSGLGSAGIRAELDQEGKLKFSIPENDWLSLKGQLKVQGEGKLFAAQPTPVNSYEDGLLGFSPALAQDSFRELRQLLDSVVAALDKVGNLREQLNQRQQDVRDFLARQESLDEQQWAKSFAGAVFNINNRKASSYTNVAQTVVAQAQLTRFAVVSLLS